MTYTQGIQWDNPTDSAKLFNIISPKVLIKKDNQYGYYTQDKFISLGTTYPTVEQFKEHGMEDLSVLDKQEDVKLSVEMDKISDLRYEKVIKLDDLDMKNLKEIKLRNLTGPGPQKLIAGDLERGFYGEVSASELWTGTELSALLGITQGTIQFDDTPWLKWAYKGKTLFRPKKAFRHSISWNYLNEKGVVYGGKTITHESGYSFDVRLMKGALTDPSKNNDSDRGAKNSEWNHLMLPIHIQAKDKSWAYPAYVEDDVPYWGIDYTDADLQLNSGSGIAVWCQETPASSSSSRVDHGVAGVSHSSWSPTTSKSATYGFAPVLELLN